MPQWLEVALYFLLAAGGLYAAGMIYAAFCISGMISRDEELKEARRE